LLKRRITIAAHALVSSLLPTDAAAGIPRLRALKEGRTFLHSAAAKSLATIEAQSRRDAGGKRAVEGQYSLLRR
jgi:hypothetical protein